MKTTSRISIVIVTVCAFACATNQENLTLGEAQSYLNLSLYPVYANSVFLDHRKKLGRYLTLKEALDNDKVLVTEHVDPSNADTRHEVNTLFIENISADTLLILNGEVVTGGDQDRMVTTDVVLAPHSGKLDLAVFCVEEGRWNGAEEFKIQGSSLPPNDIRKVIAEPDASQDDVWEEVKVSMDVYAVSSPSSALNDLKVNTTFLKKIGQYTDILSKAFADQQNVIGIVAISGGEIIGCDLFATPGLFAKHYQNLLQSYAAQAQTDGFGPTNPHVVGDYWRRVMGEMKLVGFLSGQQGRSGKYPAHFSMK